MKMMEMVQIQRVYVCVNRLSREEKHPEGALSLVYYTEIATSTVSEILVITELIVSEARAQRTLLLDLFVFRIQAPSE